MRLNLAESMQHSVDYVLASVKAGVAFILRLKPFSSHQQA